MPQERNEKEMDTTAGTRGSGSTAVNREDKAKSDSTLISQAKSAAGDVYETVANKATSAIDEQKAGLSGKLTGVADTVRRLSGTLHETEGEDPVSSYAAQYTDTAVQKIESIANYFERADLKEITRDIESYARRNPAVFLGSAFAIGIMAARFVKSTPPSEVSAGRALPSVPPQPRIGGGEKVQAAGSSTGI